MKKLFYTVSVCLLGSVLSFASEKKKPNVILIIVDDMGWSDLGCYGSEINTPNIDALAENGILFKRFHNIAKCGPSRLNLLTGDGATNDRNSYNLPTLGHILKSEGYHTYASGKHHSKTNLVDKGFDRYYGLRDGMCNHFNPGLRREGEVEPNGKGRKRFWCDDELAFDTRDPKYQHYFPKGFYSTDAFTNKALEYLDSWQKEDSGNPFFLYLAYTAPHDPLHAWPQDIAKYKGKYDSGYKAIRQARYRKQQKIGLIDPETFPLSPAVYEDWESLPAEVKLQQAAVMEIYAAMIDCIDQRVGQLVQKLRDQGEFDNTLILFCSDNGCERTGNTKPQENMGSVGSYLTPSYSWSNVSNTPYRFHKADAYNGGSRTPFIAHWPKGIKDPGRLSDKFSHFVDVMPTLMDLSGAKHPERTFEELQGESFSDVLRNETLEKKKPLYMLWGKHAYIIDGGYKLVTNDLENWSLYDLNSEETEITDVTSYNPELAEQLLDKFNNWREKNKNK